MTPPALIITDVDGCLSSEQSVAWELDGFFELARRIQAANRGASPLPPFTLCTGRPQPYAECLMKLLDVRFPAVCENGAVLYSLQGNLARYGPGVDEVKLAGLRAVRAFIEAELLPPHSATSPPTAVLQFGKEAQLSIYSERPEIFPPMQARIEQFVHAHSGPPLLINTSHYYLNISLLGVDKGAALNALLRELNLTRRQTCGIGDTEGDLPLRDAVGWFACPANSREAIKAVADYVSPFPTVRGMLDILNQLEQRGEGK